MTYGKVNTSYEKRPKYPSRKPAHWEVVATIMLAFGLAAMAILF